MKRCDRRSSSWRCCTWGTVGTYDVRIPPSASPATAGPTTSHGSGRSRTRRSGPTSATTSSTRPSRRSRLAGTPPKNRTMAARAPAAWSGLSSTLTTRPAGPHRPHQGHGQRPRARARLEHRHPIPDVAPVQHGADVLGIDHLGAALHGEDVVGQAGPQRHQAPVARGAEDRPLGRADDLAVGQHPHVVVEDASRVEVHQVVPALPVDQQADLAGAEGGAHRPESRRGRVNDSSSITARITPRTLIMRSRCRNTAPL